MVQAAFLPTLRVNTRIADALKDRSEETRISQTELRRCALRLYLFGERVPGAVTLDGNGHENLGSQVQRLTQPDSTAQ